MLISCGRNRNDGCSHRGISEGDCLDDSFHIEQQKRKILKRTAPSALTLNDAKEWEYVAEGGANVVFRQDKISTNNSISDCVLRVPKSSQPFCSVDLLDYIQNSVLPIMNDNGNNSCSERGGGRYQFCGRLVAPTSPTFLSELNEMLQSSTTDARRPDQRRGSGIRCHSTGLSATSTESKLMILPNVVNAGELCIELKPKSSLGPFGNSSNKSTVTRYHGMTMKQQTCRYCMHQAWKEHCGKIPRQRNRGNLYCPIDLFSNDEGRMKMAIRALLNEPQNNLRLFQPDGQEVTKKVTKAATSSESERVLGMEVEEIVDVVVAGLRQSRVLEDLHRAHELDSLDIEGMWHLRKILDSLENFDENTTIMDSMDQSCNFDHQRQKEQQKRREQPDPKTHRLLQAMGCEIDDSLQVVRSRYQQMLEKFLLAATLKDCSILISMRKIQSDQSHNRNSERFVEMEYEIKCNGNIYYVLISIVDLDMKPSSRLSKYFNLDQDIVHHYSEMSGLHKKYCFGPTIPEKTPDSTIDESMVQIKGNMMCRILYPNPVCLLTVYDRTMHTANVMTITWLTPIDNSGTFVCSINKRRYTAELLHVSSIFVLNVPTQDMEETVLGIGSCSGREIDKFQKFGLETCCPGHPSQNASDDDRTKHAVALQECVAHTLCIVKEKQDQGKHWLFVCAQQLAWSRKTYFEDGKRFRRSSESLSPYLTFLGSKTFGSVV